MGLSKERSQLADANSNPIVGPVQDGIDDVTVAGADSANLIAAVNDILAVLRAHGLIKDS